MRGSVVAVSAGSTTTRAREYGISSRMTHNLIEPVSAVFAEGGRSRVTDYSMRVWLAENIGIARMEFSAVVTTGGAQGQHTETEAGVRRNLLRWSVQ